MAVTSRNDSKTVDAASTVSKQQQQQTGSSTRKTDGKRTNTQRGDTNQKRTGTSERIGAQTNQGLRSSEDFTTEVTEAYEVTDIQEGHTSKNRTPVHLGATVTFKFKLNTSLGRNQK